MSNVKIIFLFILFISSPISLYCQENDLSLSDALKYAIANNEIINASAKSKEVSQYQLKSAKGKYLPNIYIEGSVNKMNDSIVLDLSDARTAIIGASVASLQAGGASPAIVELFKQKLENFIPNFSMKFQDDLFYKLSANIIWPLFTGGKISANATAKTLEVELTNIEYEKNINSTITSVIESYFQAKLAQEAQNIRKDYLTDIKQHYENAQKLFEVGIISKTNKLRAEVALSEASREYQKAIRDFELSLVVLSNYIGKDIENANLTTDFNQIENLKKVDYYEQTAYSNNTILKNMNKKREMLDQKKKAIKGDFMPTIAAFGRYEIYKENLTLFDPEWVAGINAKLNIFNGGSDYNEYKAYSAQQEVLDLYIQNTAKIISTAIKKYHHDVETALEQYESLKNSQALTEENLNLYKKSFKEGIATSTEVIDAELALEKVKLDQSKALFDYNVAYAKLIDICAKSQSLMDNITGEKK